MLSASDLTGFDLASLEAGLAAAALRQDRRRRQAESIGVPEDCKATTQAVSDVDADAAALADAARLVGELMRRFAADEGHRKPKASVTHLRVVPKPEPRPGIFARTMAALSRPASPTTAPADQEEGRVA